MVIVEKVEQHGNRHTKPRAAYLHVPFCAHHCGYCDFAIAVSQEDRIDAYVEALGKELARLETPRPMDTLFLGGGTPTYLSVAQLSRLLELVVRWLPPNAGHEFTIEANPGTLDAAKVSVLAQHGITRVSLGAQSFHQPLLNVLERDHAPADVPRAVELVRKSGFGLSLDLIFGVPGQTIEQWQDDLDHALALAPNHLSTYGLTYEKGTPLWKQRQRGLVIPLHEDTELQLYARAIDVLEGAGFEQYEISSFARPGKRCRHNQVYWANDPHYGFGMGAARYLAGKREVNTRDLHTYLQRIAAGEPATFQSEELDAHERARETMSINLRRKEGIQRRDYLARTGFELDSLAGSRISTLVDQGMLADDGESVFLTREGKYVADAVIECLLR